jgi:hypothetical protein
MPLLLPVSLASSTKPGPATVTPGIPDFSACTIARAADGAQTPHPPLPLMTALQPLLRNSSGIASQFDPENAVGIAEYGTIFSPGWFFCSASAIAGIVMLTLKELLLTMHTVLFDSVSSRRAISIIGTVFSPRGLITEKAGSFDSAACGTNMLVDAKAAAIIDPP